MAIIYNGVDKTALKLTKSKGQETESQSGRNYNVR